MEIISGNLSQKDEENLNLMISILYYLSSAVDQFLPNLLYACFKIAVVIIMTFLAFVTSHLD